MTMAASASPASPDTRRVSFRDRLGQLVWSLALPAALAAIAFRWLIPSRLVASGGVAEVLARLAGESPLVVALVLFIVSSQAIHYWRSRFWATASVAPPYRWTGPRFAVGVVVTIAVALLLRTFVVETYWVTGTSMLPDLGYGDRLLVNKMAYGVKIPGSKMVLGAKLPKRGDIIVFKREAPDGAGMVSVVKRVIGLPGDKVAFSEGRAIVNGRPLATCDAGPFVNVTKNQTVRGRLNVEYLDDKAYLTIDPLGERGFMQYDVRKGEVFVVGDDRGASSDSRFWGGQRGAGLPIDQISGRVSRVLISGRPDGKLDFSRLFSSVDLDFRQAGVDLKQANGWIADCLKQRPKSTTVPPPGPAR
jgi:signal peptidase I